MRRAGATSFFLVSFCSSANSSSGNSRTVVIGVSLEDTAMLSSPGEITKLISATAGYTNTGLHPPPLPRGEGMCVGAQRNPNLFGNCHPPSPLARVCALARSAMPFILGTVGPALIPHGEGVCIGAQPKANHFGSQRPKWQFEAGQA